MTAKICLITKLQGFLVSVYLFQRHNQYPHYRGDNHKVQDQCDADLWVGTMGVLH
jgi:hypothetical protein